MQKKYLFVLLFTTILYADCTQKPTADKISVAIQSKDYQKAKKFLNTFEKEVKEYEEKCNTSKEMYEELNVILLEYQDHIADLNDDLYRKSINVDCSNVPSRTKLEEAFKAKDNTVIENLYMQYKKDSDSYLENCASHESYEAFYEISMLCDDSYTEWKQEK